MGWLPIRLGKANFVRDAIIDRDLVDRASLVGSVARERQSHMQTKRLIVSVLAGCALVLAAAGLQRATAQETKAMVWPSPAWQIASPEDEGMDSEALAGLVAFGETLKLDSLLIARRGRLVLDAYYSPYSANTPHSVNSATKAVIATLIAMLHANGVLDSLDHRVVDYFADRDIANLDEGKRPITVQHLLNMTSGIAWDDELGGSWPSLEELRRSRDWVQFILGRPMANQPDETFYYNSGNSHLLSALITKLTGKNAEDFARDRLFGPLGITDYFWSRDPQGLSLDWAGLSLKPRDTAKIGCLYLRHGMWADQQLLPSQWVEAINHATVKVELPENSKFRYANQFWVRPDKHAFMASGYHCQMIIVLPDPDILAVMTGRGPWPPGKLADAIAGAVKSDTALPASPEAAAHLAQAIREVSTVGLSATTGTPERR
jgi:CubicO group peptidase (beta-lactamase class C family)